MILLVDLFDEDRLQPAKQASLIFLVVKKTEFLLLFLMVSLLLDLLALTPR